MINYETTPLDKQLYGSACSTNYYYFDKLSMPQKGDIAPLMSNGGPARPHHNHTVLDTYRKKLLSLRRSGQFKKDGPVLEQS